MPKYYDVHNHLFNKNFLAKELLYRLMKEMKQFMHAEEEKTRGFADSERGLKNVISALKRYSKAIKVFTRKNSIAVYKELDKTYKGEFILTPLTFDLTYCFAPSADRDASAGEREPTVNEVFESEINSMFESVEQQSRKLSRDFNERSSREEDELWKEYLKEKERFMQDTKDFQMETESSVETAGSDRGIFKKRTSVDGWEEQLRQIIELKSHPDYKDIVFPFLAIDPRRPGIAEYAKENVGKGKLFAGIKLYCPNGYSPTDPVLFGNNGQKDGLYAFCEERGIPITAHNSDGGFATLSKSVFVSGLIHVNGKLHQLDNERLIFTKSILEKEAVYERAVTLNHPLIWGKVAEKYPNLILNLAHFGGGQQLKSAVENPDDETLWSNRIIALVKDKRYKVYTDISCYSDFEIVKKFAESQTFVDIKKKVLYGSDYTLLLFFENDFDKNVQQFKECFGTDFDVIASENPQVFLKNVI